jgi:hypothetical protein
MIKLDFFLQLASIHVAVSMRIHGANQALVQMSALISDYGCLFVGASTQSANQNIGGPIMTLAMCSWYSRPTLLLSLIAT